MHEFWYQVERNGNEDGGECFVDTAQDVANYVRQEYGNDIKIVSILRVEKEWK